MLIYLLMSQRNGRGAYSPCGVFATLALAQEIVATTGEAKWWQGSVTNEWRCVTYHTSKPRSEEDEVEYYNVHWMVMEMSVQGLAA